MTYVNEGPIGFRGTMVTMNTYHVENQWGAIARPGTMRACSSLVPATDKTPSPSTSSQRTAGTSFTGTMTYAGEGPIGFLGQPRRRPGLQRQNQWGGKSAPWHEGGQWVLGCRAKQAVVGVNVMSNDGGKSLAGRMTYPAKARSIRARLIAANTYVVENQWGGNDATLAPRRPVGDRLPRRLSTLSHCRPKPRPRPAEISWVS